MGGYDDVVNRPLREMLGSGTCEFAWLEPNPARAAIMAFYSILGRD